jgi:hypothetical protein
VVNSCLNTTDQDQRLIVTLEARKNSELEIANILSSLMMGLGEICLTFALVYPMQALVTQILCYYMWNTGMTVSSVDAVIPLVTFYDLHRRIKK